MDKNLSFLLLNLSFVSLICMLPVTEVKEKFFLPDTGRYISLLISFLSLIARCLKDPPAFRKTFFFFLIHEHWRSALSRRVLGTCNVAAQASESFSEWKTCSQMHCHDSPWRVGEGGFWGEY